MSRRVLSFVLAALLSACTYGSNLETLRAEPILAPPPNAVELARTETAGTRFAFGTPARVEVIWGVPASVDKVAAWYLDRFEDTYRLRRQLDEDRWLGLRTVDDIGVGASVHLYASTEDITWGRGVITDEPDLDTEWEGTVAVALVSSSSE